ncbi:beta-lactamase family protein [bacterium]|nr:beta-lactamase family protein [bacterium]
MNYSNELKELLHQGIKDGVFPGAVAYVWEKGNMVFYEAAGNRSIKPQPKLMYPKTLFDLASLTKPIVTATLTMQLVEKKIIRLNQCVKDILEGETKGFPFQNPHALSFGNPVSPTQNPFLWGISIEEFNQSNITIKHLLTHTSGLPAWKPLYLEAKEPERVVSYLGQIPLEYKTGSKVVYSCLGYILLGKLIEQVTGKNLDVLARELIFHPLEMYDTFYNPSPENTRRCAATEDSSSSQKRMTESYERHDWREGVLVGQVHDENAHWLGGIAGNAGLFSTAGDLAKYCSALLEAGNGILSQSSVDLMKQNHTMGLDGSRSLGWIVMPDGSLYHTGYTGTAIRLDFKRKFFAILLTNRVHPDATNTAILDFRDKFYGMLF